MSRHSDPTAVAMLMHRVDAATDGARAPDTIPTGFPTVDRRLGGGLRLGDLTVLGGDVGAGKSAMALAFALRAVGAGQPALVVSGELSPERQLERALAIEGRVKVDDLRRGDLDDLARATVGAAAMRLREASPDFRAMPADGIVGVVSLIRQDGRGKLVIVDSLESLTTGLGPRDEELAAAVRALKGVALEIGAAIVLVAGLPRFTPERRSTRPTLDDFGAMGATKQHADVALAVYREEMYDPGYGVDGATELLVLKNRSGATGYVDLYFYKPWMRFEDMLDPDR
ncbi:MAG: DnaB-like helicase C-terminal domain-containing protein [Gemmatimonadaceae bacterium]|nr:DnaB-like helicase C-terminal domain-containing protein [Gemmatimonadaceae bacterium]